VISVKAKYFDLVHIPEQPKKPSILLSVLSKSRPSFLT